MTTLTNYSNPTNTNTNKPQSNTVNTNAIRIQFITANAALSEIYKVKHIILYCLINLLFICSYCQLLFCELIGLIKFRIIFINKNNTISTVFKTFFILFIHRIFNITKYVNDNKIITGLYHMMMRNDLFVTSECLDAGIMCEIQHSCDVTVLIWYWIKSSIFKLDQINKSTLRSMLFYVKSTFHYLQRVKHIICYCLINLLFICSYCQLSFLCEVFETLNSVSKIFKTLYMAFICSIFNIIKTVNDNKIMPMLHHMLTRQDLFVPTECLDVPQMCEIQHLCDVTVLIWYWIKSSFLKLNSLNVHAIILVY